MTYNANAQIEEFITETHDGYFNAMLSNGWVRVGLIDCECHDLPPEHPEFARACNAVMDDEVEALYDELQANYIAMCRRAGLKV